MAKAKAPKYKGISNPAAHRADMERRRSAAGSPQESRFDRKRPRNVVKKQAMTSGW